MEVDNQVGVCNKCGIEITTTPAYGDLGELEVRHWCNNASIWLRSPYGEPVWTTVEQVREAWENWQSATSSSPKKKT